MYCIIGHGFEKKYIAFQNIGDEIRYGYYLTDRETFLQNLSNNKKGIRRFSRQRSKLKTLSSGLGLIVMDFQYQIYPMNGLRIVQFQVAIWIVGSAIRSKNLDAEI